MTTCLNTLSNKILTDFSVASMLLPQSDMNRRYYRTNEERIIILRRRTQSVVLIIKL